MSQTSLQRTNKVLDVVGNRGYAVERFDSSQGPIAAFRGKIVIGESGDKTMPCDTALSLETDNVPGGVRAQFTTFIHPGRQGKNIDHQGQVISNLNYSLPGKLVQDHSDNSHDILYVTSEPVSKLDADLTMENIHHHAEVKALAKTHLEHLDEVLDLQPHTQLSESEKFGQDYMRTIRGLPSTPTISYIADTKPARLSPTNRG